MASPSSPFKSTAYSHPLSEDVDPGPSTVRATRRLAVGSRSTTHSQQSLTPSRSPTASVKSSYNQHQHQPISSATPRQARTRTKSATAVVVDQASLDREILSIPWHALSDAAIASTISDKFSSCPSYAIIRAMSAELARAKGELADLQRKGGNFVVDEEEHHVQRKQSRLVSLFYMSWDMKCTNKSP